MKKLMTLTMVLAWMASAPALANDRTLTATINGLVCDFCAQALEKVFGKRYFRFLPRFGQFRRGF